MKNRLLCCFSVSMLTLSCLNAGGQTPPPSTNEKPSAVPSAPVLKVQGAELLLPVTVRDKKGAMVTTLQASDFTLTVDGHAQTIKSFTRESKLPFNLGLLVDTSRSMSDVLDSERKAAGKFVDQMLVTDPKAGAKDKTDQAFLVHFDREVELLEDFTSSREKLHRELDEMGPSRQSQYSSQDSDSSGDDRSSRGEGSGRGQTRANRNGANLYDAIYLASDELMKSRAGRKALVVFSDGVDNGSKESLNDAVDSADRANLTVYTIYFKGEQERSQSSFPGSGGRRSSGSSWPGGGGSWPGGGGGQRGGDTKKEEVDGKKILEKIATRTGGRFFEAKKKENLEEIYGQIAEELRGQYLLACTPEAVDQDAGFHKIVLKTGKDNLTVETREGYYAPDKE